jgi:hypothetical protein
MPHIFIPTTGPDDWRRLLADPDKQWRAGFSARALAHCWEQAKGFPPEVEDLFAHSGVSAFRRMDLLAAFPEYRVALPGRGHASQNDLFVLAKRGDGQLAAIMVEGKVSEPFGPAVGEWLAAYSREKKARLGSIEILLGLDDTPLHIRYQLLHRTASAVIVARRFNAASAVMLAHSFSQDGAWFEDFAAFTRLFGAEAQAGHLLSLRQMTDVTIYAGWVQGKPERASRGAI